MKRPPLRILDISGSAEERGHRHGETHADEIRAYTEERVALVASGLWSGGPMNRTDVLDLAESMLPAHEDHSEELAAEMHAMAAAAGISSAEAVIVGGFTDFVDTVRAAVGGPHPDTVIEDDCTAFIVPDSRAGGAGLYGQTWDMHDTATEFVVLLRIRPDEGPDALVFTTVGALGQIGMNREGVCVGINNLVALDGTPGVTWPQVVRQALKATTAEEARDEILSADLAGGHNFLVFDRHGSGYNIEAMPSARPVTALSDQPLVHTNHTLDPEAKAVEGPRASPLQDSSRRRLDTAIGLLDRWELDEQDLMAVTRDAEAVCQVAAAPYHIESSGAAVMRPKTLEFWAVWGLPKDNEYHRVEFP